MPFTILFAILFAKIKGYKISYLFKSWTIYPIILAEIVLIFFQMTVFFNIYYFIQFSNINKLIHLMLFLVPFFIFKLYKAGLIGSISIVIGTAMNKFVMLQNGGKMPVFPTLSKFTGYYKPGAFDKAQSIHILGSSSTNFKIFSDYIDLGYSILSVGDLFVHFFAFVIIFYTIKALNIEKSKITSQNGE